MPCGARKTIFETIHVQHRLFTYHGAFATPLFATGAQQYISILLLLNKHVAVNNIKPLSVTTEMQEWVLVALPVNCKIFRTDVNINCPELLADFNQVSSM